MGKDVISKIAFVCSDMWEPYLKLIRENCSEALHILDRFYWRTLLGDGGVVSERVG
jgi:transposase